MGAFCRAVNKDISQSGCPLFIEVLYRYAKINHIEVMRMIRANDKYRVYIYIYIQWPSTANGHGAFHSFWDQTSVGNVHRLVGLVRVNCKNDRLKSVVLTDFRYLPKNKTGWWF